MSQAVLDGVRDLLPTLRERADEAERLRVVPEASIKELEETGFFRLLQPKRFDGLESDPIDFYTAVRDIATACGSTGWVSSVVGVHPWQVALFADEAQQAVWGSDTEDAAELVVRPHRQGRPDATAGSLSPASGASPPGATTASGCCSGGWCSTPRARSSTSAPSWSRASDYEIVDVWDVVGLRGTGSNDIVVEEVFIPEAFTLSMSDTGRCSGPGQEQNTNDLYKLPFHSIFTNTITTPIIGMAMGAYAEHVEMQQKRTRAAYLGEKASLDPFAAVRIARASSEIDAAWALLVNNIREEQAHVAKGEKIPLRTRLKVRRDQVLGIAAGHRRHRLAVRGVRGPGARQRHLPPACVARRARRPGARRQRPRAGAADVRRPRVRPQDRPGDVLSAGRTPRTPRAGPRRPAS